MVDSIISTQRRRLMTSSLLALTGLALGVTTQADSTADSSIRLRIGFLKNYEPFSFIRDGKFQGFDVDVLMQMCKTMNWGVELITGSMPELRRKCEDKEIDAIGNQLLRSQENRRLFDFVQPSYASIQLCAIQHEEDDRDFLSLEELVGKKLGVLAQTGVEDQVKSVLGNTVRSFATIQEAFHQLAEKQLDLVLEENLIADYYIDRDRLPLKVTAPFAAPTQVGLAVRKGDEAMRKLLSQGVTTLLKNKQLAKISTQWFGYDVSRPRVAGFVVQDPSAPDAH